MSWLYSRALVEAYSEAHCSDGAQSARLKSIDTPQAYCALDKMMVFSRLSRFGMTFGLLTEKLGAELLTSCLRDFRVTTSALPVRGPASQGQKAAYGLRWQESFAKYSRVMCTWRTHQRLLDGAWMSFLGAWPKQGTMRNGVCWVRMTSVPRIIASEFGYWPTPTVNGNYNRKGASKNSGDGLATAVKMFPTPRAHNAKETASPGDRRRNSPTLSVVAGGRLNPVWVEWLMGWPLGWTGLQPLAKDKYQQWLQQHSDFYTTK